MCGIIGFIGDAAKPEDASRALDRKCDVIYIRPIRRIIRAIPEAVFRRMDL